MVAPYRCFWVVGFAVVLLSLVLVVLLLLGLPPPHRFRSCTATLVCIHTTQPYNLLLP